MPGLPRKLAGPGSELGDTFDLIKRYVLQETVVPLRSVGKILGLGIPGAMLLATGLVLLDVAFLRALQEETGGAFSGNFTWVPYLLAALVALIMLGMAGLVAAKGFMGRDDGAKV